MNYVLSLQLDGFDNAEKSIDSLMSKVSGLGGPKISFDKWLSADGSEQAGEKIGESVKKGIKKNLTGNWLGLTGQFGQVVQKAQADLDKFWNSAVKKGISETPTIKGLKEPTGKDLAKVNALPDMNDLTPKMDKLKIAVAGIATLFNPFVGARLLSDALPKDHMAGGKGITGAIFGAAGAAGYGEIFVIVKVLEGAFKLLAKAVMNTVAAYETARQLYAKSLMQGLGLNFTVKRGMLASILGVSETDVLRFGSAMNYLNPKLQFAAETLAKTAVPLTGVGWEFKILEENLKALWAQIAEGVAPAVKTLMVGLNDFLVTMGRTGVLELFATKISHVFQILADGVGIIELVISTFTAGLSVIYDSVKILFEKLVTYISGTAAGKFMGIKPMDSSEDEKHRSATLSALGNQATDLYKNIFGAKLNNVPQPMAQMKQLIASDWEKHGLNIAGTQQSTNDLIKKGNGYLKTIADHITGRGQIPRGNQFNLSPAVSNP